FAAYQMLFWLGGALFPSMYDLVPSYRTLFRGFKWQPAFESSLNLLAVGVTLLGGAGLLLSRRAYDVRRHLPGLVLPAVFLLAYTSLISFGRSVPRGLDYTIRLNLHYSYIAVLTALVSIALAAWLARPAAGSSGPVQDRRRGAAVWAALVVAGLCVLVAINAAVTMRLVSAHRHFYSAPKLELLHHARRWHEAHRGAYFVVSEDCPGNEVLTDGMPWFRVYPRHVASTFRYLDALYPETSLNLNGGRAAAGALVVELSCAGGSVSSEDVLGSWRSGTGRGRITRTAAGPLLLVTERGEESALVMRDHRLLATRWNAPGVLSADHRYIVWTNGAVWRR
ncbi:MAG TPA: hypothetical protein VML54_04145, partial [Candidatus Limnocylindrales bacterium]|nr:hypothetical protein [Candidatus Limnocylindrales bacterium]